ncbi:hypothetical protein Tco_0590544 [Tanacetum coccineum]
MRDPYPKNPSLVPPPRGTDDVIKPKFVGSGWKGFKKCSINHRDLKKELDDMEYEDDVSEDLEDKDEEFEVRGEDIGDSKVFDGVGVNKGKENEVNTGSDGVGMGSDVGVKISKVVDQVSVKENMVSNVSQGSVARNVKKLEKWSANVSNIVNDMHVPFSENDMLNLRVNEKGSGSNGDGRNVGDIEMPDSTNGKKPLSFINDIQGMSSSRSNKLSRIPVKMNDKGENVVDIDPIIEGEISKGKGLLGPNGGSGGRFEGGFGGNVGSCGRNGGRGGSIARRGGGSLAKLLMESKDGLGGSKFMANVEECLDGWVGAGGGEVKGGGVDFRVSRILLGEIPREFIRKSGSEAFRVGEGAV